MDTLTVQLHTIDEQVKFSAQARQNPEVVIDYFPPAGKGEGYTSLELLLASFASCVATVLLTLWRHKMKKNIAGLQISAVGQVRDEHPKALSQIQLSLQIQSPDLTAEEARQTLQAAEEKLCPVWAMIKGNVTVAVDLAIQP